MKARLLAGAACGAALALTACGGSDAPATSSGTKPPDPNDKRGVAIACVRGQEGLPVTTIGAKAFRVGGPTGPRVDFFVSSGEAEGKQFDGDAQGAEQIGAALLYINDGTEQQLDKIEKCLDDQ